VALTTRTVAVGGLTEVSTTKSRRPEKTISRLKGTVMKVLPIEFGIRVENERMKRVAVAGPHSCRRPWRGNSHLHFLEHFVH
jgi:hypothetical protein